jgi:hypothetical protein
VVVRIAFAGRERLGRTAACADGFVTLRRRDSGQRGPEMGSQTSTVLYIVLLIATVVAVDVFFFRNQFWPRLTVNIGILLVFSAFYFRFLKRP